MEWGGNGEGEVSLRATWDQGGRDRTTQEEGFQVSEKGFKGKKGIGKGSKQRGTSKGLLERVAPTLNIANLCKYIISLYECI